MVREPLPAIVIVLLARVAKLMLILPPLGILALTEIDVFGIGTRKQGKQSKNLVGGRVAL